MALLGKEEEPDKMFELLKTLWTGAHIRVNGRNAMYDNHCRDHGWWLRVWFDEKQTVLALSGPPEDEREFLPITSVETLELIAKPDLYHTDNPIRGDWFYFWYTLEKPRAYVFWDITGPYEDGTYTMQELQPWKVERYKNKPKTLVKNYGWTNYVRRENGALYDHDQTEPISFFKPPFLPDCLRLPPTQLRLGL